MTKAVVNLLDGTYINIPADKFVQDGDFLYMYAGEDELVGMVRWELISVAKLVYAE